MMPLFQVKTETVWKQINQDRDIPVPFMAVYLSHLPPEVQALERGKIAEQLQASFALEDAPLMRVAWFNLGENKSDRLLIIIHL